MEGFTARWYANLTLQSLDEFKALARRVADETPRDSQMLEVAPGPGYFAIELAKLGCTESLGSILAGPLSKSLTGMPSSGY
jgi:hypothetical protein